MGGMESYFRKWRLRRHLTQAQAAETAGVSQAEISRGETHGFSYGSAARISEALGMPLERLLPERKSHAGRRGRVAPAS